MRRASPCVLCAASRRASRARQAFAERRERRPRLAEEDGPPVVGLGSRAVVLLRPVVFKPAKVAEE